MLVNSTTVSIKARRRCFQVVIVTYTIFLHTASMLIAIASPRNNKTRSNFDLCSFLFNQLVLIRRPTQCTLLQASEKYFYFFTFHEQCFGILERNLFSRSMEVDQTPSVFIHLQRNWIIHPLLALLLERHFTRSWEKFLAVIRARNFPGLTSQL